MAAINHEELVRTWASRSARVWCHSGRGCHLQDGVVWLCPETRCCWRVEGDQLGCQTGLSQGFSSASSRICQIWASHLARAPCRHDCGRCLQEGALWLCPGTRLRKKEGSDHFGRHHLDDVQVD